MQLIQIKGAFAKKTLNDFNQLTDFSNHRNFVNKAISGNLVKNFLFPKNKSRADNR